LAGDLLPITTDFTGAWGCLGLLSPRPGKVYR
jgi:hypothetical protein